MVKSCTDCKITQRFDVANFLRVAATLFVFFLHGRSYVDKIADVPFLNAVTKLPAWAGVWIFLFLSGYTVGLGFFKGRYSVLAEDNLSLKKLLRFYLSRFLKIAPLYYIYCFIWSLTTSNPFFVHKPLMFLKIFSKWSVKPPRT